MQYGGASRKVKQMQKMERSREIVLSEMTPLRFHDYIKQNRRLRAATVQIVGTKTLVPCSNCEQHTKPFTECIKLQSVSDGCCANCLWKQFNKRRCSFVNGTLSNATGIL